MTHRRRGAASGLAAGVLLAALAGCAGPSAPGSSPSAQTPAPTSAAPADVNSRAPESLAQGGIVRLPLAAIPTQWNPLAANATADTAAVQGPLSAPAFLIDASGTARPNPDVLVSATASGTPTVATLRLSPLAVWGDGTAITAADWVATWTAVGRGDARFAARALPGWDRVAGVKQGADDHEVVVTYTGVVPDWTQPLVAGPARAASVADPATFASWPTYRADWFAGPYVVTHADSANGLLTLEPNPRWWGARPRLGKTPYSDAARLPVPDPDHAPAPRRANTSGEPWASAAASCRTPSATGGSWGTMDPVRIDRAGRRSEQGGGPRWEQRTRLRSTCRL